MAGGKFQEPDARLFISGYIDRNPIENNKINISDTFVNYQHNSQYLPPAEFDPLEFLAAASVHIPNKYEQTIRYYGYYSARTRGKRRETTDDSTTKINDIDKPKKLLTKLGLLLLKKSLKLTR